MMIIAMVTEKGKKLKKQILWYNTHIQFSLELYLIVNAHVDNVFNM